MNNLRAIIPQDMPKTNKIIKLIGLTFLWLLLLSISGHKQAHAYVPFSPDPGRDVGIPGDLYDYLASCNSGGPAFVTWISPTSNQGSYQASTVAYGTASISLKFNDSGEVCQNGSSVTAYTNKAESASSSPGGSFSGIAGMINGYGFGCPTCAGSYNYVGNSFTFSPTGGFTTSGWYNITVWAHSVVSFSNGTYRCVPGNQPTSGLYDYGPCPQEAATYAVYVPVGPPPPPPPTPPVCSPSSQTITAGTLASFTTSGSSGTYAWSAPGGSPSTSTSSSFSSTYNTAGSYTVTITRGGGGSATCSVTVVAHTTCSPASQSVNTNTLASFTTTGGTGNYIWSSNPSPDTVSGVGTANFKASWAAAGTKTVNIKRGTSGGAASCTVNVVAPVPNCSPSSTTGITNTNITFTASAGNGTFSWSAPSGMPNSGSGSSFTTSYSTPNTYTVTVTSGGQTDTCTVTVTPPPLLPYLRVYGGDVAAGNGFGPTCTNGNTGAQILAFNDGAGAGSGTQLADFALGTITGFTSANGRSSAPQPPRGLSFANTAAGDPTYGGSFSSALFCVPDYWSNSANINSGPNPIPVTNLSNGQKKVYYFSNNVTINGNIMYSDAGAGTWTDLSKISSFYLIVKGANVYIDHTVSQIDGVIVALPSNAGANGIIYTCTNGSSLYTNATLHANCNNQLVINGAFIARRVKFQRTKGDVPGSSSGQAASDPNIAEVFQYGPELWLADPAATLSTPPPDYDSITSLPPVL